ncbi:MAG: alpha-L-fucosidase, partial [Verrucomicrobiota bacterium]
SHGGKLEAVLNLKRLEGDQQRCMVNDIERGRSDKIEPHPWQTDTCIGGWHYLLWLHERHQYKKPREVIQLLVDVVSKNGNLMLSIPVRGDGTIDEDEENFLKGMGAWMDINKEGILATRPWNISGEGPSTTGPQEPGTCGGTVDVPSKPYTAEDIRFTVSKEGGTLYAYFLAWPTDGQITIHSLAKGNATATTVRSLSLLGFRGKVAWNQDAEGLHVALPPSAPGESVWGLKLKID